MSENPVTTEPDRKEGEIDLPTAVLIGFCFIGGAVLVALLQQAGPIYDTAVRLSKGARRMVAMLPDIPSPDVGPSISREYPFNLGRKPSGDR
jgi:hypothetical protein